MDALFGGLAGAAGGRNSQTGVGVDYDLPDAAETIQISSLALLKMLKHGRAGVPMEVMGLLLGEFIDDYTVRVVDVFAMPQSGTNVTVEAVDPVFQMKMMEMLKQCGRPEMVVGWYHSHPGFGCWLSSVDTNTHQSFEQLNPRAVAVVIDPIQSVKGKVVMDAFRLINPESALLGKEYKQTTSNVGHLQKPTIFALVHGLNRYYYSLPIEARKTEQEEKILLSLSKKSWNSALKLGGFQESALESEELSKQMVSLGEAYHKSIQEELVLNAEQLALRHIGRQDPKRHLDEKANEVISRNVMQTVGAMANAIAFCR